MPDYSYLNKTEIFNAFGASRFTGSPNNSTSTQSINISSNLRTGSTQMLLIDTNDNFVNGMVDSLQKTAMATATLFVIGYYKI